MLPLRGIAISCIRLSERNDLLLWPPGWLPTLIIDWRELISVVPAATQVLDRNDERCTDWYEARDLTLQMRSLVL